MLLSGGLRSLGRYADCPELEGRAEVQEPVGPAESSAREDGTAERDEHPCLRFACCLPASIRRGHRPSGGTDDDHKDGGQESEGEQRTDDLAELPGATYGSEVRADGREEVTEFVHAVRCSRGPGSPDPGAAAGTMSATSDLRIGGANWRGWLAPIGTSSASSSDCGVSPSRAKNCQWFQIVWG